MSLIFSRYRRVSRYRAFAHWFGAWTLQFITFLQDVLVLLSGSVLLMVLLDIVENYV